MIVLKSLLIKRLASALGRYIMYKSFKAFIKTRKGKSILITLVLGLLGISLPPEAIDGAVTFFTALDIEL